LDALNISYEILFITDINKDDTFGVLKKLNVKDRRIKTIKLTNSYGQHVAIVAGLNACSGQVVVLMDGDLQDCPEDIPNLYAKLLEGYDIVYGIKERKNDSFLRNFLSGMFVWILNKFSDVKLEFNTSMFRIISRRTVEEVLRFKESQPSLTFIMSLIGFPCSAVKVTSAERKEGKTKYSLISLLNFAISSLISFSTKPIRMISFAGFYVAALSFIYLFVVIIQTLFFGMRVLGWPTIISLITLLGGVQLFGMGIIGEYIANIFMQTKNRPLYIIDERVGIFDEIS
jgi:dolichol-phosphate mannosyltransferase